MKVLCTWIATLAACWALAAAAAVAGETGNYDRTEADGCANCHFSPGEELQTYINDTWLEANHANSWSEANGNTYCMKCHAPFQADPNATHDDNDPVPLEESQAVTCGSCHPPHDLRVEWGTNIGLYDIATQTYSPLYEPDPLCESCHSGSHHQKQVLSQMEDVRCIDCHMPKIPIVLADGSVRMTRTHHVEFELDDDVALADKAYFSCGTEGLGCHAAEDTAWAVEVIRSGIIHVPGKQEVDAILTFFEDSVVAGTLTGAGSKWTASRRLETMRSWLQQADDAFGTGDPDAAFDSLLYAYFGCDGLRLPLTDMVTGEAAPELCGMIQDVLWDLY